jgi:L-threonylcarbamoyladenylate synthase
MLTLNRSDKMKPRILSVDPFNINGALIKEAVEIIHNRGLVAFPTETVYGLGANALDPKAVAGIFEAKKRPFDDPLIVHIASIEDLFKIARHIPHAAERLVNRFWPGALTLILEKTDLIPDIVTTGLDTVAVRMPANLIARAFIEQARVPLAAPSANLFGKPSPTSGKHVMQDLEGRIDIILDGGKTEIGIESTVVGFSGEKLMILRPGGIDIETIREIAPEARLETELLHLNSSPGKYPRHYSPEARILIVDESAEQTDKVLSLAMEISEHGKKAGILAKQEHENLFREYNTKILGPGNDPRTCAARLFSLLRDFDAEKTDVIVTEAIPEKGVGVAVMNRLRKAAGPDLFT